MDLITHGLAGGLVARAGFTQRIGRPAMIALIAGGMIPDVDVVMALVDELSVVRYHRGLTHSFVGAFLLALPLAAVLYRFGKYKRFWPLVGLCALGVLTHIALDLPTSFGTMVFMPFSHERYALNLIFIIDPIYSGIILLALGLGYWRRSWTQTAAILGISGLVLYLGVASAMHKAARERFKTAVEAQGLAVLRTEAYPRFPGLWTWLSLAETPTAIIRGRVDLRRSAPMRLDHYPKPGQDGLFTKAGELEEVRAFFAFARFPWMTARQQGEHTILEYHDLRFGAAPHHNDFRLQVVLDGDGGVQHIRLNHRF
ncbi:MAG TPA: metal-dependent hydrolase [Candidatus Tectomicrobia bacterium]|nr:metal-dependent hydrolase [Candidatus Tectomicrobia bacterium]